MQLEILWMLRVGNKAFRGAEDHDRRTSRIGLYLLEIDIIRVAEEIFVIIGLEKFGGIDHGERDETSGGGACRKSP